METPVSQTAGSVSNVRLIARILLTFWAALWVFFIGVNLISGIGKPIGPGGYAGFAFVTLGLILVVGTTGLALRRARTGGIALVIVGLAAGAAYLIWPPSHTSGTDYVVTSLMLGGPPLTAGVLFLASRRNTK